MKTVLRCVLPIAAMTAAVVVPYALADAEKPLPGRLYAYAKVLPKDPGWHSPTPKRNFAGVRVGKDGIGLEVGWSLWTRNGCSGHDADGRPFSYPYGADMRTTLKTDGSFHVVDTTVHMGGARYERSEAYGRFVPAGDYFDLRARKKLYVVTPSGSVVRCDGRWLKFRARLQQRSTAYPG